MGVGSLQKSDSLRAVQGAVMATRSILPVVSRKLPQIEGNPVRNELLLAIPPGEFGSLFSQLTFLPLRTHDVLQESGQPIKYVYFMDSGLASVLNSMRDGKTVEVGLTGKEGCTGLPIAAGLRTSASLIVVQVGGSAFRMTAAALSKAICECPMLARRMQQYSQVMSMQGAQLAACNRLHEVEERLARWLLMSQDRLESNLVPLTHEFLAHMLGTRRSSVTVAAGLLQKAGLITYNRGEVTIEDRARLEDASCECYALIRKHTETWEEESR
jgi:CRP-like cAMP-binding protein